MLIQVGSAEGLLDAGTAGAADVPVTPEVWPHVIQAWDLLECPSGAWPRGASKRGRVHPPKSQAA